MRCVRASPWPMEQENVAISVGVRFDCGPGKLCRMESLRAWIEYSDAIHGWSPVGLALISYCQDNPILEAHRTILASEFPRRKFETELRITVGGLRAVDGTYYNRREHTAGFAKLEELLDRKKLGLFETWHFISKTVDRENPARGESSYVSVALDFARPQWPERPTTARASIRTDDSFGERHLDTLVVAFWDVFAYLADAAVVKFAVGVWGDQSTEGHPTINEIPVSAFMLVEPATSTRLGGSEAAAEQLGALSWKPVRGSEANGLAVQLGRRPEDTNSERMAQIRELLRES